MLCKKKKKSSYTKNLFGCERTGDVGEVQLDELMQIWVMKGYEIVKVKI